MGPPAHERDGADTDRKVSDDEWLAKAKQKGIRVRSQPDVLVCVVAQNDFEENHLLYVWSRSGRMSKWLLTLRNTREQFGTKS